MSAALDIFAARVVSEEGKRKFAYNDATGKTVTCKPGGNLSIGIGINLETGLDDAEIDWLFRHRAGLVETQLQQFSWYTGIQSPARESVMLDIAFNGGVGGLLHYPHMIAAASKGDWVTAAAECTVADPRLDAQRYAPLRMILLNGG